MKLDDKIKELERARRAAEDGTLRQRGFSVPVWDFDREYGHGLAKLRALAALRDRVAAADTVTGETFGAKSDPRWNALVAYLCVSEGFDPTPAEKTDPQPERNPMDYING